jgi:hypothetical protein
MNDPSVEAKVFSSRTKNIDEVTKRAPATLSAASFAARRSATFSSIATSNGSVSIGERHVASRWTSAGASWTGRIRVAALALACAAACLATRSASSGVRSRDAAKPHAPLTSARTPNPSVSESSNPVIRRSRVASDWLRLREMRTSA